MENGFRKVVSLILSVCLLLTSVGALAEGEGTEAAEQIVEQVVTPEEQPVEEVILPEEVEASPAEEEAPADVEPEKEQEQVSEQVEQIAEEPEKETAIEEPAKETVQEEPVAADPVEVNAENDSVAEEIVDSVEPDTVIDTTRPVSENAAFENGYVVILRETSVYAEQGSDRIVALLESGLVEVISRVNAGKAGDQVYVNFDLNGETVTGYVNAEDVRPCTAQETEEWTSGSKALKGSLVQADAAKEDDQQEELSLEEKAEDADADEEAIIEENETLVEGKTAPVELEEEEIVIEEAVEEKAVVEEEVVLEDVAEVEAAEEEISIVEEEQTIEKEDEATEEAELTEEENIEEMILEAASAVAGDVVLSVGTVSNISIPKGINAKAYASFEMEAAGLLTLTFKSVSTAHGNVMVTIKDTKDTTLWSMMWASNVGTVNYSAFVEADSYVIIIEKTDASDDAAYILSAEPIVSKTGEAGYRNNTQNNAASITVNGDEITGIISAQDWGVRDDFYTFTLSTPGYVSLQYTNLAMTKLRFYLYGDDTSTDNEVASLTTNVAGTFDRNELQTISFNRNAWLDAGVYYIIVDGYNATTDGRYRIKVSMSPITITEKEKNNTFQQAYDVENMLPLNDTVITSLLGESDTVDCYDFYLAAPTLFSASLKIQFPSVTAAVYSRDGQKVAGSDFGATSTTGSDGNPYELELNKLRLDAGYYYVRISRNGSSTGKYSISGHTSITASKLEVEAPNGGAKVNIKASVSGFGSSWKSYIYVYENTSSGMQVVDAYEYSNVYDIVTDYYPRASGSYTVQFVVTDGSNWDDRWDSFTCTVKDFNITTITATTDAQGNVHCVASYTGNNTLKGSVASWYLGGVLIDSIELGGGNEWTFKAPTSGLYNIQFAGTLTGTTWKDGWTTVDVEAAAPVLPLLVSTLNVSASNKGVITCSAETKEGIQPQSAMFVLYKGGAEIARTEMTTAKTGSFTVGSSGSYSVQCVAYDGVTWAEKWETISVSLSPSSILQVKTLSATADGDGKGVISLAGTTQGGGALTSAIFYLYYNGKIIGSYPATNGMAKATVYQTGTYGVQYVVADSTRYADKWTTVSVTLNAKNQPVVITSLTATADTAGAITIKSDYTASRSLEQLNYYVYDASNNIVNVQYSTASKQAKLYVTKSGTYQIQAVAFDGEVWDDEWTTATVSLSGGTATTLSVTSLTVTGISPTSFYMAAVTNDNRQLVSSKFHIYQGSKLVRTIDAPNKEATCSNIPVGNYSVQYVAYDGTTWAEKWAAASAGASTLAINSMTVTKSGSASTGYTYTCNATITNNMDIQVAKYVLYDASGNQVAAWYWDGTGSYLDHTFLVDSAITVSKVQYVLSDGVLWVDAWDTP